MRRREVEFDKLRANGKLAGAKYTLGDLIVWYRDWYRDTVGPTAEWGATKAADLERIRGYDIAKRHANTLTADDYITHVVKRREEGAGPAAAGNDLIWIVGVLRSARPSLKVDANLEAIADVRTELRARKLIAKSNWRDRRVAPDEDARLVEHFRKRDARAQNPDARHLPVRSGHLSTTRRDHAPSVVRARSRQSDRLAR